MKTYRELWKRTNSLHFVDDLASMLGQQAPTERRFTFMNSNRKKTNNRNKEGMLVYSRVTRPQPYEVCIH